MNDISKTDYILGVKIKRDRSKKSLTLSQEWYIKKILKHFQINSWKPKETPVVSESLSLKTCPKIEKEKEDISSVSYSSAVGN